MSELTGEWTSRAIPPPRAGLPTPPNRVADGLRLFEALIARVVLDGRPFDLHTSAPDDATVALLVTWATAADVIAFYQERIANEGFLQTARRPASPLAIARNVGSEEVGGPLQPLLGLIRELVGELERDFAQLYDDLFIDAWQDWVVPYFAEPVRTTHPRMEG